VRNSPEESADLTGMDRRIVTNLKAARLRAGLSQTEVGRRMQEMGYPTFIQQTITRIEAGRRVVSVGEAASLARCTGTTLDALTRPPEHAREGWLLVDKARQIRAAMAAIRAAARDIRGLRKELDALIRRTEDSGQGDELADELALARRALKDTEPPS
jgi:transcriptional regulator with XRE-family HTH domain